MNTRISSKGLPRLTLLAAAALGLAITAPAAWAQPDSIRNAANSPDPTAASPDANSVGGVVVHAPPPQTRPGIGIPPDKEAAYAAAAANDQAWRDYRDTLPSVTEGTMAQAKAYPGLRAYLPSLLPSD